jgi:hypothetical protein
MSETRAERTGHNAGLLRENPVADLRHLAVVETGSEVVISGVVRSFYLKQMAQEAVRPALNGRRLRNRVTVLRPDRPPFLGPAG